MWLAPEGNNALGFTSNSLTVPVHVHPSLGQTAAKASTSLRAALSGNAWTGENGCYRCVELQTLHRFTDGHNTGSSLFSPGSNFFTTYKDRQQNQSCSFRFFYYYYCGNNYRVIKKFCRARSKPNSTGSETQKTLIRSSVDSQGWF